MTQHLVMFYCPGTFAAETAIRPIESWDAAAALEMSKGITARYGARPFGFRFITRERGDNDLDSKETARSGMYYIGGKVETLEEIYVRGDPRDAILISNMKTNKWDRIIVHRVPYVWTSPLHEDDKVLAVVSEEVGESDGH
jgi:hypothetical protein